MKNTVLLIIDVQEGLDDPSLGKMNNPDAKSNIALLLSDMGLGYQTRRIQKVQFTF